MNIGCDKLGHFLSYSCRVRTVLENQESHVQCNLIMRIHGMESRGIFVRVV